jgi:hypothetical protein
MSGIIPIVSLIMVILTTLIIIWGAPWRWMIIAMALQYIAVFLFVSQIWPVSLAAVKLISGWMAGAVLGASQQGEDAKELEISLAGRIFRVIAGCLVFILVISIAQTPPDWLPVNQVTLSGGLILIGMGLFQLGLTKRPLAVIVGILTAFSGFEIIYAAIVSSVLVAGLLSVITLGLSLVGAYWMIMPGEVEAT